MLILCPAGASTWGQDTQTVETHSYHGHPPVTPPPPTLDPNLFKDKHIAFVVYTLARQIEPTLYQVPCYCPCDRFDGHTSLLDCFTDRHGEHCPRCQIEVIYCFEQWKLGKTPTEIRKGLEEHEATRIDAKAYADQFLVNAGKANRQ
jgi:Protein of unknown function with PCYCGC motif